MFAVPLPFPLHARPGHGPRVAVAPLDAILVDITRPVEGSYRVRIYDEEYEPPVAEVAAAFVLYGARLTGVERRLRQAWSSFGLAPVAEVRAAAFVSFDLARRFALSLRLLEALQRQFPP